MPWNLARPLVRRCSKGAPTGFNCRGTLSSITPSSPGAVCKKITECHETEAYKIISNDPLASRLSPSYLGEREWRGDKYLELQDLLQGFKDPHVMDIKMGCRTFLESEVSNTKARCDLYKKMVDVDSNAPTLEEHAIGAVTKLRYMMFREKLSSSQSKGFRIEALKIRGSDPITDLKRIRTHSEVLNTFTLFLNNKKSAINGLLDRLKQMRSLVEGSEFFKTHEIIGSSIFIVYDDTKVGAWLIDFAKSRKLPENIKVDHRSPWSPGNCEEGLLHGMDQLIEIIEEVRTNQSSNSLKKLSTRSATIVS